MKKSDNVSVNINFGAKMSIFCKENLNFGRNVAETLPQSLHDILEIHSFAQKKRRFLHKILFFNKTKQRHQKLTLFKNRRYFFKKT